MIDIPGERATSAVQYANSLKAEMERLMVAGDVTDRDDKTRANKISRSKADAKRVDRESRKAARMLKKGLTMNEVADALDLSPDALRARLLHRKLIKPVDKAKQAETRRKLHEAVKRVNKRAVEIGSIKDALEGSGVTNDQYHTVRAKLNLPRVTRS